MLPLLRDGTGLVPALPAAISAPRFHQAARAQRNRNNKYAISGADAGERRESITPLIVCADDARAGMPAGSFSAYARRRTASRAAP